MGRRLFAFNVIAAIIGALAPVLAVLDMIPGGWFDAIVPNNLPSVIYQGKEKTDDQGFFFFHLICCTDYEALGRSFDRDQ